MPITGYTRLLGGVHGARITTDRILIIQQSSYGRIRQNARNLVRADAGHIHNHVSYCADRVIKVFKPMKHNKKKDDSYGAGTKRLEIKHPSKFVMTKEQYQRAEKHRKHLLYTFCITMKIQHLIEEQMKSLDENVYRGYIQIEDWNMIKMFIRDHNRKLIEAVGEELINTKFKCGWKHDEEGVEYDLCEECRAVEEHKDEQRLKLKEILSNIK